MLFFKKISKSTWVGLKENICVVSMSAAVENTFSIGTEVAVILPKNIDTVERCGFLLARHHINGFNSRDADSSLLYAETSSFLLPRISLD